MPPRPRTRDLYTGIHGGFTVHYDDIIAQFRQRVNHPAIHLSPRAVRCMFVFHQKVDKLELLQYLVGHTIRMAPGDWAYCVEQAHAADGSVSAYIRALIEADRYWAGLGPAQAGTSHRPLTRLLT